MSTGESGTDIASADHRLAEDKSPDMFKETASKKHAGLLFLDMHTMIIFILFCGFWILSILIVTVTRIIKLCFVLQDRIMELESRTLILQRLFVFNIISTNPRITGR